MKESEFYPGQTLLLRVPGANDRLVTYLEPYEGTPETHHRVAVLFDIERDYKKYSQIKKTHDYLAHPEHLVDVHEELAGAMVLGKQIIKFKPEEPAQEKVEEPEEWVAPFAFLFEFFQSECFRYIFIGIILGTIFNWMVNNV